MADDDELFIITHTIEDNPPNIVDPTLQLPHHILHYIFFYLSFHDLLHVRLVNKNWYLNTPSHFNFHFNESLLRKRDPTSYSLNDLWDSIRSSIDTCKNKLINAEKRVLHVEFINVEYIRDIMKLLEENNFHEHVLCDEVTIPSLQELKLERVTSSEEEILSKFINFPHLETLLMGPEKPINISGSSLRKWILSIPQVYKCTRKSVVSSPNLSYFKFKGTTFQSYLAPSKLLETNYNIVLVPKINKIMKRAWFLKLRSHLQNFSNHNTTLEIRIKTSACHPSSKPSGRAPTQPLHYIKHIMVDMNKLEYQEEHLMRYIIDNLLWMSHPNTLTLSIPTSFSPTAIGVIKKLYGRRNRNCCSGTHDKCWRHFLKYFEVKEEEEKEHPDAPSSLYAHPRKDEFRPAISMAQELQ